MVDKWEEEEIEDGGKSRKKMLEFYPQYLEAEKHNQTLPDEIKYPSREKHTGAVHNSKMIDTAEITQSLTQNITSGISSLEIDIDYIEEEVEQEQFQAHIEQPPKN
jgi:hypothetical protein